MSFKGMLLHTYDGPENKSLFIGGKSMGVKKLLQLSSLGITIVVSSFVVFSTYLSSMAVELRYFVPCYEGDELAQVRAWEKNWAGKKIDSTNVDQVKEFLPENMYMLYKDSEKWGKAWFEIAPYRQIKPTAGTLEATKKYSGACKVGPNDELLNWVAGIPFPNPQTPVEIMYNFDITDNHGDNAYKQVAAIVIDAKRRNDKHVGFKNWLLWFAGRTVVPPLPEITPNPKGIFRANHTVFDDPPVLKGQRSLAIKWQNRLKDWGSWSFSTGTRRVMRRSTAARQDHSGGSDMCRDDERVFDYSVTVNTYQFLGRKEVLLPRHVDPQFISKQHVEGYMIDSGYRRERNKAYIIEAKHKDPNYLYSKQIWYVDPESWWILYADKYDKQGRLWKIFDWGQTLVKLVGSDEEVPFASYGTVVDVQRMHATTGPYSNPEFGISSDDERFRLNYYTPDALQRFGR
jgi:hypothetical protein